MDRLETFHNVPLNLEIQKIFCIAFEIEKAVKKFDHDIVNNSKVSILIHSKCLHF